MNTRRNTDIATAGSFSRPTLTSIPFRSGTSGNSSAREASEARVACNVLAGAASPFESSTVVFVVGIGTCSAAGRFDALLL